MDADDYQRAALRTDTDAAEQRQLASYADRMAGTSVHADTLADLGRMRDRRLLHGALGCGTEAGELLDAVKRATFYGKPVDAVNVVEECGDLLWYIAIALDAVGATMGQAMARNVAKLRARYPDYSCKRCGTQLVPAQGGMACPQCYDLPDRRW